MAVSSPRGMRDFLPHDKRRRDHLLGVIRETYVRHGFEEIETPAIEDSSSLHSGLGGDNEKLSFSILKRGLSVDDAKETTSLEALSDLGLRFDLTVPLARFYASHKQDLPSVFRSFHTGPVWRAERPQKGRYRQFVQCDIDILGDASTLAEAEVLLATSDALTAVGVSGFSFRVNDRRLLTELLSSAGIPLENHPEALIVVDKLDKIGHDGVLAELVERLGSSFDESVMSKALTHAQVALDATAIAEAMGGTDRAHEVALELTGWASEVAGVLGEDCVVVDLTLVRGMGYYTGSIVEISHPDWGTSIGGGGRYDGMIGRFLGTDVPEYVVYHGYELFLELLPEHLESDHNRVALLCEPDHPSAHLLALKMELVNTHHTVRLVKKTRNMKPTFERLAKDGFARVAEVSRETTNASALVWRELD